MRCFSRNELEAYAAAVGKRGAASAWSESSETIDSDGADERIAGHLTNCARCREVLRQIVGEQRRMERLIYSEEPAADFTAGVMAALEHEPKPDAKTASARAGAESAGALREKRAGGNWRRTALGAAAALLLAGAGGWYALEESASPDGPGKAAVTSAAPVRSFDTAADPASLKRAAEHLDDPAAEWNKARALTRKTAKYDELGLAYYPDIQLEDKKSGFRFELQAVLVDAAAVTLITRTTDGEGNPVKDAFPESTPPFTFRGADGEKAAVYASLELGGDETGSESYTYLLNQPAADSITLSGSLYQIVLPADETKGTAYRKIGFDTPLQFEYEFDLDRATEYATITEVRDTRSLPEGIELTVQRIVRTPYTWRVDLGITAAQPDKERQNQIVQALKRYKQIYWHVEDSRQKVLSRYGARYAYQSDSLSPETYNWGMGQNAQGAAWAQGSVVFPAPDVLDTDAQPLTLVMDRLTLELEQEVEISFEPAKLAEEPAVLENEGDRFEVTGAELGRLDGQPVVYLNYNEERVNARNEEWEAVDENGASHAVVPAGGEPMRFAILNMTALPERLTLRRTMVPKNYGDLNEAFELPAGALSQPQPANP
ncbi:hypothetical protein QWJ34_11170 [Saccharibacillus sp. CPCC 101409]|uniref:hypothetical protein n=1 Tax=Saccharibacillus sp. CPCC 101409 TaxID=3058041 RepID=UPI002672D0A9|nr:hypothetical protein [Saccharibacillus sp. CPCC 101409]MDO3410323.1 hypothetical protein [Saccharibacillus sp. CPCC 101409]